MTQDIGYFGKGNSEHEIRNNEQVKELHLGAREGDKEKVRQLLSKGVSPDVHILTIAGTWETPLLVTAKHDDPEMLHLILEASKGLDLSQTDTAENTVLHMSAMTGAKKNIGFLLSEAGRKYGGLDINAVNCLHKTPLYLAVENGQILVAFLLLETGADPDIPGMYNCTPLRIVSAQGHLPLVKRLLEAGADPNILDASGTLAIHDAAANGNAEIVKALLEAGSEAAAISRTTGMTPLQAALASGEQDTARVIREHIAAAYAADPSMGGHRDVLQEFPCNGRPFLCYVEDGKRYVEVGTRTEKSAYKPGPREKLSRAEFDNAFRTSPFSAIVGGQFISSRDFRERLFEETWLPDDEFCDHEEMKHAAEGFLGGPFHFETLTPEDKARGVFCRLRAA